MAGGPLYSIDTSALIHGWSRAYPRDIFPRVWDRLDGLINDGSLIATMEVYREIQRQDDDLARWCEERLDALFVEIDDPIQIHVSHIMATYPRLVDTRKGLSTADPFVIGLAMCHNDPLTVVTQESGGSATKPRLQYVCQTEGVRCINLLQLIQEQRWVFGS
jgi:hypothetical protein